MPLVHVYNQTVADGTATSVVRPSDWNSAHNQIINVSGNSVGAASATGTNIVFQGGNNVTLSVNQGANAATIVVSGANTVAQTVQTQTAGNLVGIGYTSTTQAGVTIGATLGNNGLSLAQPPFITTYAAQTVQPVAVSASGGSSLFSTLMIGTTGNGGATFTNSGGSVLFSHSLQQLSNTSAITANAVNTSVSASFFQTSASSNLVAISNSSLFELSALQTNYLQWGNSSTTYAGTNATITMASNGLSISAGGGGNVSQTGPNFADQNGVTVTSGTVVFANSNGVSFGLAAGVGGGTMTASAAGGGAPSVTYLTYQNRQLGASSSTQWTNGQVWMIPFRVAGGFVSASTIQYMQSNSGSYTSAVAATRGETMNWCIYSANATNLSQFDSMSSGQFTWQIWNSGTSSASYAMNGTTSSSAGSNLLVSSAGGIRMLQIPYGATIAPGLYVMAFMASSSTAGYSGLFTRYGIVMDAPMPLAMGNNFGAVTATSIGYVDAGSYGTTTAAMPVSVNFSQIRQHSNLVPYFKMGAI
jgi:hypothetical protein